MWRPRMLTLAVALALAGGAVWADDLTGSSRFPCAAVQATACVEEGECGIDLPWSLNIPQFIVVDLEAGRLSTTEASSENRTAPIQHLTRDDGVIVFPTAGQTPEQQSIDEASCYSWAVLNSDVDPFALEKQAQGQIASAGKAMRRTS